MTRRIALSILLTCWLVLLAGGVAAYVAVRASLLDEFDASLVRRASVLPEVVGPAEGEASVPAGDRYVVQNRRGQTVARSGMREPDKHPGELRDAKFAALADGTRVRTVTAAFPDAGNVGGETLVVYSSPADRYDHLVRRLWVTFAVSGLAAGALTAGVAVIVARAALRPLTVAAGTVASIDEQSLGRRLDGAALPAELRPMAERLNQMLARLDDGFRQRKQFMADAAHELRTPVSALMTSMEVALRRSRDAEALTRVLHECLGETRVLRRLVDALLEQYRADALGANGAARQDVDVSALLDLCADAATPTARHKGIGVTRSYPPGVRAVTEPQRVRSIVSNLLDNALAYNVPGGTVSLACEAVDDQLRITVRDTGRGIPGEALPHVFEPFVRGPDSADASNGSRNGDDGHCGLGLYLVKSHAGALGGTCAVSSEPGRGSEFRVSLPLAGIGISAGLTAISCLRPILCGVS